MLNQGGSAAEEPAVRRSRKQTEFEDFMKAYDAYRPERGLADGYAAAEALRRCMGFDDVKKAIDLIVALAQANTASWTAVLARAIECGLDRAAFDRLKSLFKPKPSQLLAARMSYRGDEVVLTGTDARTIGAGLFREPGQARACHPLQGGCDFLVLVEMNEKLVL